MTNIYIQRGEERLGPLSLEEVQAKFSSREFGPDLPAWHPGLPGWVPLRTLLAQPVTPPTAPLTASPTAPATSPAVPVPESSLLGILSSVAALCALLVTVLAGFVLLQARQHEGSTAEAQSMVMLGGFGVIFVVIICIIGGILAMIGCFSARSKKPWCITGLCLNVLIFLLVAGATTLGLVKRQHTRADRSSVAKVEAEPVDQVATQSISNAPSVPTCAQHFQLIRNWYDQKWIAAYPSIGHHNPQWDEPVRQLIAEHTKLALGDVVTSTEAERLDLSRKILATGCDDPLALYLCANSQVELHEQVALLEKADTAMKAGHYAPSVGFCLDVNRALHDMQLFGKSAASYADGQSLVWLDTMLKNKEFSSEEMPVLKACVLEGDGWEFFKRNGAAVCERLESSPNVEPWLAHLARGHYYVNQAWAARGSGYANTVSDKGWQGFSGNLDKAAAELTQSWKLNPHDPSAAAEMITVSMGQSTNSRENMRLWFDRAVAAEFDNCVAYRNLLWGLRPRWMGSFEDMLAFGRASLRTGRYNTIVPKFLLVATQNISEDASENDASARDGIFQDPGVYHDLQTMFDHYLHQPGKERWHNFYLTHYAIVAYHAGDFATCRSNLEALKFVLDKQAVGEWEAAYPPNVDQVCALTSAAKSQVSAAEESYQSYQIRDALAVYKTAEAASKNDARSLRFIHDREAALALEQQLDQGGWVDFTPPADFAGWQSYVGQWSVPAPGVLEVRAGARGMMLKSLARVGPDFEIRGQIEFVSSTTGDKQAGVLFGYPEADGGDWESFRMKKTKHEGEVAYFARNFRGPDYPTGIHLLDNNTFHLQVWHGGLSATLNESKIITDFHPQNKRGLIKERDALVGLGAYSDQNDFVVRYRNVQIRRLTAQP